MKTTNALVTYTDLSTMGLPPKGTPATGNRIATKSFIVANYYVDENASPFSTYTADRCPPYQSIIAGSVVSLSVTPGCTGGAGTGTVLANGFSGGTESFEYISISDISSGDALTKLDNPATRTFLGGATEYTFTGLGNATYYVAIMDYGGNKGVSTGAVVNCITTTTTTTTATPTYTYFRYPVDESTCSEGVPVEVWSYTYYTNGYYRISGILYSLVNEPHVNYTTQISGAVASSCTPTTTTTTTAPPSDALVDIANNTAGTNITNITINGVQVDGVVFPVVAGDGASGSTTQTGASQTIVVSYTNISNDSVEVIDTASNLTCISATSTSRVFSGQVVNGGGTVSIQMFDGSC